MEETVLGFMGRQGTMCSHSLLVQGIFVLNVDPDRNFGVGTILCLFIKQYGTTIFILFMGYIYFRIIIAYI